MKQKITLTILITISIILITNYKTLFLTKEEIIIEKIHKDIKKYHNNQTPVPYKTKILTNYTCKTKKTNQINIVIITENQIKHYSLNQNKCPTKTIIQNFKKLNEKTYYNVFPKHNKV